MINRGKESIGSYRFLGQGVREYSVSKTVPFTQNQVFELFRTGHSSTASCTIRGYAYQCTKKKMYSEVKKGHPRSMEAAKWKKGHPRSMEAEKWL